MRRKMVLQREEDTDNFFVVTYAIIEYSIIIKE